jgi:chemotaxis methyl-accepting protein methylase/signal transduction histidine kinase/chemotaxis response regulator CheB
MNEQRFEMLHSEQSASASSQPLPHIDGEAVLLDGHPFLEGDTAIPGAERFHVVGVGASAGGLESLERFFAKVPADTGMAFVVIQHLSPDFKSLMDELLARHTDLPICRAEDGMPVEPNAIYLIPPKKEMIISHGRLLLTDKDPKQSLTMPIDRFFRSLAQDQGDHAIGIILSGTGTDGSRGIRDIHEAGGLVICESRETAKFDGMPQAAIETGTVDQILAPEAIPTLLVEHAGRTSSHSTDHGRYPPHDAARILFKLLNEECGIDFSHYKPNTVNRRIQRRLSIVGARGLNDYVERLRSDRDELNSLYKDLLIGVTRFFRDQEAFAKLAEVVVPELVRQAADDEEIRVWVAACATGEEAYSIAMLIHEQMEAAGRKPNLKVFATDVHRASLDFAAAGVYGRESLSDVAPERLSRYFDQKPDGFHVVPELRQIVVFAKHNLINDAPFTKLNLITCRNLLIYFDPAAQKRSLSLFHFGLKTGGILFLGASETPGHLQDEFDAIDAHWKIYRKCRDVRLADVRLPAFGGMINLVATKPNTPGPTSSVRGLPDVALVGAYDAMLDRFMPPGLLINERRELLHTFGGAERHLRIKPGRPSTDVLDMLGHELRTAVTGAVQRALKENAPVSYSAVRIKTEQGEQQLRVGVEPLVNPRSRSKQLLIVLEPLAPALAPANKAVPGDANMQQMSRERIEALETEVRYAKENLQATIEELETSNEELQAANEELVTSNEELQSTNEELQSVNEELYTVNAEYQKKISELSELTSDMDNLLASTDVGTIFLDQDLCIRKFTPQIASQFHFLPQDIGRPIDSFAHNIIHPGLIDDLRHVAATNQRREREVQDRQGNWQYLRMLPYRMKKKADGVVLTLYDISPIKKAQAALGEAVRRRDQFLAMLSHELRNPLGAILHAANILCRRESEDESMREIGEVMCRQGEQMARLLDDLLDVSRITQDKMEMRKEPTSLSTIVEGAVESVRPQIEGCKLNFTVQNDHSSLHVNGDPVRLQQAIANLLVNAAKYTPPTGTVRLEVVRDGAEAVIRVSDNGVGIAQDNLQNIFDLFVQCDQTLSRSKGGMGVGLTLVRSIVEQHKGSVTAHSDGPGHGSRFEIRLPLLIEGLKRRTADRTGRASQPSDGSTIVVVEDQEDNRRMLRALLELDGYRVFTAENGPKGLAAIEQHRPDIALIDIGLPGLTGYEVATQVRESLGNKQTYLVALTGYGQPEDVQAAFDAGFDNHIVKPFDAKKLAQILQAHRRP